MGTGGAANGAGGAETIRGWPQPVQNLASGLLSVPQPQRMTRVATGGDWIKGCPHPTQNLAVGSFTFPQLHGRSCPGGVDRTESLCPHPMQNFASSLLLVPHVQFTGDFLSQDRTVVTTTLVSQAVSRTIVGTAGAAPDSGIPDIREQPA